MSELTGKLMLELLAREVGKVESDGKARCPLLEVDDDGMILSRRGSTNLFTPLPSLDHLVELVGISFKPIKYQGGLNLVGIN